jgi:hypothetical protein
MGLYLIHVVHSETNERIAVSHAYFLSTVGLQQPAAGFDEDAGGCGGRF